MTEEQEIRAAAIAALIASGPGVLRVSYDGPGEDAHPTCVIRETSLAQLAAIESYIRDGRDRPRLEEEGT